MTSSNDGGCSRASNDLPTTATNFQKETAFKEPVEDIPQSLKLLIGLVGIYGSHLYQGSLQEDVFNYISEDGKVFYHAWFLEAMESFASVIVGLFGLIITGTTSDLPLRMLWLAGSAQVAAKVCTNLALSVGLSYPVMVLAKSAKLFPVMIGSLIVGGDAYDCRQYAHVAAVITGTCICMWSKENSRNLADAGTISYPQTTTLFYICMSLVFDGAVAGFQKRLQRDTSEAGIKPTTYDFMFWTSVPMALISGFVAWTNGEFATGIAFCIENPELQGKVFRFSLMAALGQIAIFYVLAHFSPLVLCTVTTTRKIFSVLLSIFLKGHYLSWEGWAGVALAFSGIVSELEAKRSRHTKGFDKKNASFSAKAGY
eukprot:CAMPEP_0198153044 /NCGR_PEP_ID=MMETSP1443-20131203/62410_1 /TAXON_ID=186043 /ORGANISM="Entomoneis sp., Strain CCMP2396" /LENGTH=369 /DNA_ID=CAMNT_0043819239 /DNA_START=1 /DNA_END=1110 /DNA_ORIENTATION=+